MKSKPMRWLAVMALAGLCILLAACNGDKGNEPKPVKDYVVYIGDPGVTPQVFIYHPLTRQVDSSDIPWRPYEGVTVSANGKRLYLAQRTSLVVVDTDSLGLIAELPYKPDDPVAVSPDNQLVAIADSGLHILNAEDNSVVFQDTTPVIHCVFSADSKTLYCAGKGGNFVYKVNLSDSTYPVSRKEFADGMITYVVPSPDESKWFLYWRLGTWTSAFEAYDVLKDSVIFREILVPGYGQIAITPNGKYVFYTNACRDGTYFPQVLGFTVFDVDANKVDRLVSDNDFFTGTNWIGPPLSMVVTPDGCWLVMLGGCTIAQGVLYLYDIQKRELVHREFDEGGWNVFTNLSVQNAK
ncbi:MAG: hypothetical protein AB1744_07565 [Candidatus Zixiibacteriota bacterium]